MIGSAVFCKGTKYRLQTVTRPDNIDWYELYSTKTGTLLGQTYLFVTDASEDTVTIGVIVKNHVDVTKLISDYLQALKIELKDEFSKKLFDYKCFLDIHYFWSCFEDIRDMNHEKWPLIIDAGDLQKQIKFKELLKKQVQEDR